MKKLIFDHKITTKQKMREYIEKDCFSNDISNQFILKGINQIDLNFNKIYLKGAQLPQQQNDKEEKKLEYKNDKPHLWFDNFALIENIQFNDLEIMGYKDLNVFKIYNHPPIINQMKEKPGALQESSFKKDFYSEKDICLFELNNISLNKKKMFPEDSQESSKKNSKKNKKNEEQMENELDNCFDIFDIQTNTKEDDYSLDMLCSLIDSQDEFIINNDIPEFFVEDPKYVDQIKDDIDFVMNNTVKKKEENDLFSRDKGI